jgi:putative ABC transport system ATP-binding protein
MGPSGSGKTTLMNLLGLLDKPTSGEFLFEGENVTLISKRRQAEIRNQKIGFVFQQFNLLARTSVLDNVLLPTIYGEVTESATRARELLDSVGLAGYEHNRSNQLSGGEVQRVAIARALVMRPSLLLADEPTGNLDSKTSLGIMEIFRRINDDGATIVLITHEAELAKWADRTIRLFDGEIVESEVMA